MTNANRRHALQDACYSHRESGLTEAEICKGYVQGNNKIVFRAHRGMHAIYSGEGGTSRSRTCNKEAKPLMLEITKLLMPLWQQSNAPCVAQLGLQI